MSNVKKFIKLDLYIRDPKQSTIVNNINDIPLVGIGTLLVNIDNISMIGMENNFIYYIFKESPFIAYENRFYERFDHQQQFDANQLMLGRWELLENLLIEDE